MATTFRTIGHEDRLSIVDHLDELRNRLKFCLIALVISFGVCFWQNHALLHAINSPLSKTTEKRTREGKGPNGQLYTVQKGTRAVMQSQLALDKALAADEKSSPQLRRFAASQVVQTRKLLAKFPNKPPPNVPVTLNVSEPFTATATVALYFGVLFALPVILFQLYGFLLPAFSPREKKVALPLMLMIPFLALAGIAFGYFLVLPAATRFLQNFNSDNFNVLVQAANYYKFAALLMLSMALIFQLPVGILALTRLGVIDAKWLRKNRRYAIVVNTVVAAALPGVDPVSMLVELVPLLLLYELSVFMAKFFGGPEREVTGLGGWFDDDEDDEHDEADDEVDALP